MHITVLPRWDFKNEDGEVLHPMVLSLLDQINRLGNLKAAAKECGFSYRHAWNILNQSADFFKSPLVLMEKGRGATLTVIGQKLLWSNQRIEARLSPEIEGLATELNVELQGILMEHRPVVKIFASHGYAVALMTRSTSRHQVEIHYHAPRDALMALNDGRCRIAGFHVPIGMTIPSQQAQYKQLLNPQRFGIIEFVHRQQGLIFPKANPFDISGIKDLNKKGIRLINRQLNSGTRELLDQLLQESSIEMTKIAGYENQEYTHSAVAAHISSGMADVGFGIQAAAESFDLGFIPIIKERYQWAYPLGAEEDEDVQSFIATLTSKDFQDQVNLLPGYECVNCGELTTRDEIFK